MRKNSIGMVKESCGMLIPRSKQSNIKYKPIHQYLTGYEGLLQVAKAQYDVQQLLDLQIELFMVRGQQSAVEHLGQISIVSGDNIVHTAGPADCLLQCGEGKTEEKVRKRREVVCKGILEHHSP